MTKVIEPDAAVSGGGAQSVQQVPTTKGGGSDVAQSAGGCGATTYEAPVKGGGGSCYPYVQPAAPDPTAVAAASGPGSAPAPTAGTGVPGAVDPNTGQPLNPADNSGAPAPIEPAPVASAPAPAVIDPATGQPVVGQAAPAATPAPTTTQTPAPIDPATGLPAVGQTPQASTPASSLPTWKTQWEPAFVALGVDPDNLAKIGGQMLDEGQLSLVYMTIRNEMAAKTATQTPPSGVGGWSPEWEQKFTDLGFKPEEVAEIAKLATAKGADDVTLQQLYDQMKAEKQGGADPTQGEGWTKEWEAKFTKLGMPKTIVDVYAKSGATTAGLQAAYDFAAKRFADFKKTGYYETLQKDGMTRDQIWGVVLAEKVLTKQQLEAQHDQLQSAAQPAWKKLAQLGITFFPGGEAAQYLFGHKFISGKDIDRGNPMNVIFAGLSGLAAFAALRGAGNVHFGRSIVKQLQTETGALNRFGAAQGATKAVEGVAELKGFKSTVLSYLPMTKTHRAVIGFGAAESAAKTYMNGGRELLLLDSKNGALQVAALEKAFTEIQAGTIKMLGGGNAYLGQLKPFTPIRAAIKGPVNLTGNNVFTVGKNLRLSRGDQVLAGMLDASGQRLALEVGVLKGGSIPKDAWLNSPGFKTFIDDMQGVGVQDAKALGQLMSGNSVKALGADRATTLSGIFGRLKPGPTQWFQKLGAVKNPEWYTKLSSKTFEEFAAGATHQDLLKTAMAASIGSNVPLAPHMLEYAGGSGRQFANELLQGLADKGVNVTAPGPLGEIANAVANGSGSLAQATGAAAGAVDDLGGAAAGAVGDMGGAAVGALDDIAASAGQATGSAATGNAAAGAAAVADNGTLPLLDEQLNVVRSAVQPANERFRIKFSNAG